MIWAISYTTTRPLHDIWNEAEVKCMFCKRDDEKHELFLFAWRWRLWRVRFMIKLTFSASDCIIKYLAAWRRRGARIAEFMYTAIVCTYIRTEMMKNSRVDFILFYHPLYTIFVLYALFFIFSTMRMTLTAQGWLFIVQEKFLLLIWGWFWAAFRSSSFGQLWVEDWRRSKKKFNKKLIMILLV